MLFEGYEGGKAAAMAKRRAAMESDPKRIAKKKQKQLAEMKKRLEDIKGDEGEGGLRPPHSSPSFLTPYV